MLETFTPAVCGSRKRQIVAQALFTVAAVATAAALGLVLGLAGAALGARQALLAAAALALVAAAREAGILRFSLPQSRRQVPERWRFELPLPVWASGYGAGLGAGFFTFQPVSTFWVACAGALALARPVPAALCLSLYGLGRAAMVVWPRRRLADPTAAVERLATRRGALLRANAIALVTCAALLGLAPVANGATRVARSALDPSVSGDAVAFARQAGSVVVRPSSGPDVVFPNASQPALSRGYLAFVDGQGIAGRALAGRHGGRACRRHERLAPGTRLAQPRLRPPGSRLRAHHRQEPRQRGAEVPREGRDERRSRAPVPARRAPRVARGHAAKVAHPRPEPCRAATGERSPAPRSAGSATPRSPGRRSSGSMRAPESPTFAAGSSARTSGRPSPGSRVAPGATGRRASPATPLT